MLKLLRRLICISTIAIAAFVAISLWSGGERFRWFGRKVEQQSEKVGEKADRLKEKGDGIVKGIKRTKERISGQTKDTEILRGGSDRKSH